MTHEDNPFVGEEQEQFCWREPGRPCGVDCVAYDDRCETDPLWNPCLLLNLKRAKAKSLANISMELKRQNDFYEEEEEKALAREKRVQAEHYAEKLKEMDPGPPDIR